MDGDPLDTGTAKVLIRRIAEVGTVSYSKPHALDRLEKHHMTMQDIDNVLRRGRVADPEWENGSWRYHVFSNKFVVVVELLADDHLFVVTAWRL